VNILKIHDLENNLDNIFLSSKEIEDQIINYKLQSIKLRDRKMEFGVKIPMFVTSFYFYILKENKIPNQKEFWNNYLLINDNFFQKENFTESEMHGLQARAFRAYTSLVRDVHFGALLRDDGYFDGVFYNVILDTDYGIDLVVSKDTKIIGLNLFTNTKNANIAREKKQYRPKKPTDIMCYEIPIDFKGSKECGDFFLYSEREIEKVKGIFFLL
jgi:hypothetical protein